jgi:RND superfamily putative drug exporter
MILLGESNWWFPKWLDRVLPRVSVDPDLPDEDGTPGTPPAPAPEPVSV